MDISNGDLKKKQLQKVKWVVVLISRLLEVARFFFKAHVGKCKNPKSQYIDR